MIQRVQSLFLFFAALLNMIIYYYAPIFINMDLFPELKLIMMKDLENPFPLLLLLMSTFLALFAIFQFRNRLRQLMIVNISRLSLAISFSLLIIFKEERNHMGYGIFYLTAPYIILFISSYFIKKDEKLVRSADRIR